MNKLPLTAALSLLIAPSLIFAGSMGPEGVSPSGFFIGLGGSYNSMQFNQNYSAFSEAGVIDSTAAITPSFALLGGSSSPFQNTQTAFSPQIQAGYLRHFSNPSNLWGIKYSYQYTDLVSTNPLVDMPVPITFSRLPVPEDINALAVFTTIGVVSTRSLQTNIKHEMLLLALMAHSFSKTNVYLGLGPSLFGTDSDLYGIRTTVTAGNTVVYPSSDFFSSAWVWGGAAQMGMTYFLDPSWFLDFNYTYASTGRFHNHNAAPFTAVLNTDLNLLGTLRVDRDQRITAQAVQLTVNKLFSL